jgi:hypothetical protein
LYGEFFVPTVVVFLRLLRGVGGRGECEFGPAKGAAGKGGGEGDGC